MLAGAVGFRPSGSITRGERLTAPELIDLEVVSVLRRLRAAGQLDARRAGFPLADLIDIPLRRQPHKPFLPRCWELPASLTSYAAAYVALAEALDVTLVTADDRLSRAPGPRCTVEVL